MKHLASTLILLLAVIGSEFCDFLSTLLTFRLIKSFGKAKVLEQMTYGKVMSILHWAKKIRHDESSWQLIRINHSHVLLLKNLCMPPKQEEVPKYRPGRQKINIV